MDNIKDCGKSSAPKKLKGFTLIELIIVMAIIAILASMISILATGIVRDARLDTARSQAQSAYTAIQNTLVQLEINNKTKLLDPSSYPTPPSSPTLSGMYSGYVTLEFVVDHGVISKSNDFTIKDDTATAVLNFDYTSAVNNPPTTNENEKTFRKLAKYIIDNLDMDYTGYVYAAIDMSDVMVDSVVTIENYSKITASTPIETYVPEWKYKDGVDASKGSPHHKIPFCENAIQQRDIYSGKARNGKNDPICLDAIGTPVGFYPFFDDFYDNETDTWAAKVVYKPN